jgi:hypothetical protein
MFVNVLFLASLVVVAGAPKQSFRPYTKQVNAQFVLEATPVTYLNYIIKQR